MSSTLPIRVRYASVRFLANFFLLFLLGTTAASAKTIIVGAGAGIVSVGNMTNLAPGDVLAIQPGNYLGGYFGNLNGITITNNGGPVIFHGTVTLSALQSCTFSHVQFKDCPSTGIRWDGNSANVTESYVSFSNVLGNANDAADQELYNGSQSSLKLYNTKFDSISLDHTGMLLQGSWGTAASNVDFIDSLEISRVSINQTGSNGTEVRGTFFRINAHDWRVTYSGLNPILGDVGIFYFSGDGQIHNIYRNGGRGYITRVWNSGLNRKGQVWFYNNVDLNSTTYGTIDTRTTPDEANQYIQNGNSCVFNNTSGNKTDNIGFWCPVVIAGQMQPGFTISIHNNLGFNLQMRGKYGIVVDQSNGTFSHDSSNNMYFNSATGVLDPTTCMPVNNSPVIGAGRTYSFIKSDIYGNARTGATDIGAVQHGGAPVAVQNQPPTALAVSNNITITLPTSNTTLDGSPSNDPDGSIKSYAWTKVSGTGGTIASSTTASTDVTGLAQGTYVYQLTVTDNKGATGSTQVTVVVKAAPVVNQAPVANAGSGKTITLPTNSVSLDGSASNDPDGTISKYTWAQVSGPSTAVIGTGGQITTAGSLAKGVYVFSLTVTDNSGATGTANVTVTVLAGVVVATPQPPTANAGNNQTITLPVNTATIDGSGSTAASGGTISSYAWSEVSGPSAETLTNSAQVSLTNMVAGTYVFALKVTDSRGKTGSDSVTVTVKPNTNTPPIADAGDAVSITLPTNTATLNGSNSSDPGGSIATYAWTLVSGPSNPVTSGAGTAILNVSALVAGDYVFQLKVADYGGLTGTDQVTIHVSPKGNVGPVANAGADQTITLPVNSVTLDGSGSVDPDGSISKYGWALVSGPAGSALSSKTIDQPIASNLAAGVYVFELTVTDNSGATGSDRVTITVKPAVVVPNQAPVANAGYNLTITLPTNSTDLNGSSSFDPDGTIVSYAWSQVSGPATAGLNGAGSVNPKATGLVAGTYVFQLSVKDNDGATSTDQVTVSVKPAAVAPNLAPIADAGADGIITLPANTYVLDASGSSDPDGSIVTYQWSQVSGPATAAATFMSNVTVTLTDLKAGSYVFQVKVTDNGGLSSTATMKLTVNPAASTSAADAFVIYPNPAVANTTGRVTSSVTGTVKTTMFDMNGRVVWTDETEKTGTVVEKTYALSQLAPGVYMIQVNIDNKKVLTSKFIKQ